MTINLVNLLVGILVFILIAWAVRLGLRHLGAPAPIETIIMLVLLVVFILWLIQELGIGGPVIRIGDAADGHPYLLIMRGLEPKGVPHV